MFLGSLGNVFHRKKREMEYKEQLIRKTGVRVAEDVDMAEQWKGMFYVTNGLTAFLGSYGMVECFLGSLSIEHNSLLIGVVLLLLSLYVGAIYYKHKNLGYLLFIMVYLRTILYYRQMANSGFATVLNQLQVILSYQVGLPASSRYVESVSDTRQAVSICAIYIGALIVVLLNIAIMEYMNVGDILFVTFPLAQLGMLFGMQPPALSFVLMLLSWIFVGIMKVNFHYRQKKKKQSNFGYKRRSHMHYLRYRTDGKAETQQLLHMGGFTLLVILLISLLVPDAAIKSVGALNSWREEAIEEARNIVQNGFESYFGRQGAGGVNGGKLGQVGTVRFDNQTDLIVRMAPYKTDRMYFKAYTGTVYTGRSFDEVSNEDWGEWRESSFSTNAEVINNASYDILRNRAKRWEKEDKGPALSPYYQGAVEIRNVGANKAYVYRPYYAYLENDSSVQVGKRYLFVQDDVVNSNGAEELGKMQFVDYQLSPSEIDEVLEEQRKKPARAVFTWTGYGATVAGRGESDLPAMSQNRQNMLWLANIDGTDAKRIVYLEEKVKKAGKNGIYYLPGTLRYLLQDSSAYVPEAELGAHTNLEVALVLEQLGEKLTGIKKEELEKGIRHWDEVIGEANDRYENRGVYVLESTSKQGQNSYVLDRDNDVLWMEAESVINTNFDTAGSVLDKQINGLHYYYNAYGEKDEQHIGPEDATGSVYFEPDYVVAYDSQAVIGGDHMLYDGRGFINASGTINKELDALGLENGNREELKDSITDYFYRGYVAEHNLSVPEETKEALEQFCKEHGIHPEDKDVVEKVIDALEEQCSYVLNPGVTPADRDFVTYFLKDQQKGFCVHFASTATMLFRYLGIPARYCEGYVADYVDMFSGTIVTGQKSSSWIDHTQKGMGETAVLDVEITDAGAHAWTEIYLDDYGWVPVDATPASGIENDFGSFLDEFNNDEEDTEQNAGFLQNVGMRMLSAVVSLRTAFVLFVLFPLGYLSYHLVKGMLIRRNRYKDWHGTDPSANVMHLYRQVTELMGAVGCRLEEGMSYDAYAKVLQQADYLSEEEREAFVNHIRQAAFARSVPGEMADELLERLQSMRVQVYNRQKWGRRLILRYIKNL